jgi:predicted oxidoreductase
MLKNNIFILSFIYLNIILIPIFIKILDINFMNQTSYNADITVVGAGIAGISATLELLDAGKTVLLIDRDSEERFGGLAKESFGGMFFVNSPLQKRLGIKDNKNLALADWNSFAEYDKNEEWGKKWSVSFVNSTEEIYKWVTKYGIKFFPVVHWVERGLAVHGNSVPRFHMVWGTGFEIIEKLNYAIKNHKNKANLKILFNHKVEDLIFFDNKVKGVKGISEKENTSFQTESQFTIIASGGLNGNIDRVKNIWQKGKENAPKTILNGSHQFSDGTLHDAAEKINANITNIEKMWNYAAGIPHPNPLRENHGLSIVPPKSALWVSPKGERYKPYPLITAFDTKYMVDKICEEEHKYSWQVMNKKIAYKELAVSGSDFNDGIKNKKIFQFLKDLLFGNKKLIKTLEEKSPNYITANSLDELAEKMYNHEKHLDKDLLKKTIEDYDNNIDRGVKYHNDIQLRLITHARQYSGDKIRTCKYQKINDKKAYPLIAIKENILSRKSLGGIQTDLNSRVLTKPIDGNQENINGLYAIGEASGFGGGGSHGQRALEGTFLATCIFTAKKAAEDIIKK